MKKILITGGSGTVGTAFIKEFYDHYQFYSYGRNEQKQLALKSAFGNVELYAGSIENYSGLLDTFMKIKPDIVIHAAALKQIEISESQPSLAIKMNLLGSLNVINASRAAGVPLTIGLSSDKACYTDNVYGSTKNLMERIFFEADSQKNKFVCCRLCNVAGSEGSVIPFWLHLAQTDKPLKLTSSKMNRFMFSTRDAADLIQKAIEIASQEDSQGFLILKKIKAVNMLNLAKSISSNIEITGKRPGEQLNETVLRKCELPYSYEDSDYIRICKEINLDKKSRAGKKIDTISAEKMNQAEIRLLISTVSPCEE